jgi:hypothetical protein
MRAMVPSQNRGHEPLRHPASTFLAVSEQDDAPSPVLLDQGPDTEVARDTGSLFERCAYHQLARRGDLDRPLAVIPNPR